MPVQRHVFINHRQTVLCQSAKYALPWRKTPTEVKVLRSLVADSCRPYLSILKICLQTISVKYYMGRSEDTKPMELLMLDQNEDDCYDVNYSSLLFFKSGLPQ